MAERVTVAAEPREMAAASPTQLRRQGWVPAVIYGQGENLHVQIENLTLRRALREAGTSRLIDITLGNGKRTVLAKEIQSHATRGNLLHVDFYEVNLKAKIAVAAELVATGVSATATAGLGTTPLLLHSIEIEAKPEDLISEISVNLALIETEEGVIHVRDLEVPASVTILTDPDTIVARFEYLAEEVEEEEEQAVEEPEAEAVEVIGRGQKEDEFEE
ncbi:MAG: 50S ribosomal protein L25 [Candidatus Promineifilaceae bacterium]